MDQRGQSLATYAIALGIIVAIGVVGLLLVGGQTSTILSTTSGTV